MNDMDITWNSTILKDILTKAEDYIELQPESEYDEVTVRLWGKGVIPRGKKFGSEIAAQTRNRVHTGQFILSKIDARNGAFGLIPDELECAIVTNDFPVFDLKTDVIEPEFFSWLTKTKTFVQACKFASEGSTNRVRLKLDRFKNLRFQIPSIDAQKHILTKIQSYQDVITQLDNKQAKVSLECDALLQSAFQNLVSGAPYYKMSTVAPIIRRKAEISFESDYPELGIRCFGKGAFHKPALLGHEVGTKKLYEIHAGDVIFSNVFSWEGAIAVARQRDHGRFGSHRFISCVPKTGTVTARFLCFYFLSAEGLNKIREASPGGAGRNRTLGIRKLEKIEVPIPDYDQQLIFDNLQKHVRRIKRLHSDSQVTVNALMPAVLDRAFKGKL